MKVIYGLTELEAAQFTNTAVTLGTFDGVHVGHRKIIATLLEVSRERNLHSVLVTFDPHPQVVLGKRGPTELLTTLEEKLELLETSGIETIVILDFNRQLASFPPETFVRDILLDDMNMKALVIGYDHAFGKDRVGNKELLSRMSKNNDFYFTVVPEFRINNQNVKSTIIRELLKTGEFELAKRALGYNYFLTGKIVKGHGIGKSLGYPTVNLAVPPGKLLPKEGVYSAIARFEDGAYMGMIYIGARLTFNDLALSVEMNLFEFTGHIDSDHATVELLDYIRPPEKFESKEKLIEQMKNDEIEIKKRMLNKEAVS
ncbi:MAG TPA: riboflavin biosynthesis protein RibF [candidate division Zixibacteria bacterium]|nr:riboflavin biosynthesis protein RibF [candidate division Zixibacteria bacterium]HBY99769.1 riboflavin biosynthesis protein RibF [candidate division Zixibacteria bacterium]